MGIDATPSDQPRRPTTEAVFVGLALVGMVLGLLGDHLGLPWLRWAGYGTSYILGGWFGLRAGLSSLFSLHVDIDLLMILAALGALIIGAPFEGAMLLFLFSLSNVLQDLAIGKSRSAIQALLKLRPETARVQVGGTWQDTPIAGIEKGAVFLVTPGDRLPLDGDIRRGTSKVDQASLTGESAPVAKAVGDPVFAGTINLDGALEVEVTKRADESALARMIDLVEEAQGEKAATQRLIDRFEQPYALGVIAMTALAITVPVLFWGEAFNVAFYRAMTLMVAASPCALVISTPAAVLSAIAAAAASGVLWKGGVHVEEAATIQAIAFDKTGTLTAGRSQLQGLEALAGASEDEVLGLAAAVQARSEHHLAHATLEAASERGLEVATATAFHAEVGRGVRARVDGATVHVGNPRYFADLATEGLERAQRRVDELQQSGKTAIMVAREDDATAKAPVLVIGVMAFADTLRPEAPAVISRLREIGIQHIVMLTGDNAGVGEAIGNQAGVDEVRAELMPQDKVTLVRDLEQRYGAVAMVGDGVNDAPALATATLGIAMGGAGTDVALETADVVLMSDDLRKIPYALSLGRRARRTLIANLLISLGMIVVMVTSIVTVGLALPLAVVGHEGSTVLVSLNGLRLLAARDR